MVLFAKHFEEVSVDVSGEIMAATSVLEEAARFEFNLMLRVSSDWEQLIDVEVEYVRVTRWSERSEEKIKTRIPPEYIPEFVLEEMHRTVESDFHAGVLDHLEVSYESD